MEQRILDKERFDFLKNEIEYCTKKEIITHQQKQDILNQYTLKDTFNFISVLVIVGSILVGLGILSFIASNWDKMGNSLKLIIIFALFLGTNVASYILEKNYSKTSRSLLYLGVLIFGSGIFLIGQMFNFGGNFTRAFLLWGCGALPMGVIFKDKAICAFSDILFFIYLNGFFLLDFELNIPLFIFIIIPIMYFLNYKYLNSKLISFFNNLLVLNTILFFLIQYIITISYKDTSLSHLLALLLVIAYFVIGLIMYFIPIKFHNDILKVQGNIIIGITGLIMTIKYYWLFLFNYKKDTYPYDTDAVSIYLILSFIIAFVLILFLIYLTKKGSITSLLFICILIARFYFDLSLNFMPKSLYFVFGGILLIALGIFFEKTRRKIGGGDHANSES